MNKVKEFTTVRVTNSVKDVGIKSILMEQPNGMFFEDVTFIGMPSKSYIMLGDIDKPNTHIKLSKRDLHHPVVLDLYMEYVPDNYVTHFKKWVLTHTVFKNVDKYVNNTTGITCIYDRTDDSVLWVDNRSNNILEAFYPEADMTIRDRKDFFFNVKKMYGMPSGIPV